MPPPRTFLEWTSSVSFLGTRGRRDRLAAPAQVRPRRGGCHPPGPLFKCPATAVQVAGFTVQDGPGFVFRSGRVRCPDRSGKRSR